MPPLNSAIALGIPLAILCPQTNWFYGSFGVLLGYRQEIQQVGTGESIAGKLFVYDRSCYFAVPSLLHRAGQYTVIFQFSLDSLQVVKSRTHGDRMLFFAIPSTDGESIMDEFAIM